MWSQWPHSRVPCPNSLLSYLEMGPLCRGHHPKWMRWCWQVSGMLASHARSPGLDPQNCRAGGCGSAWNHNIREVKAGWLKKFDFGHKVSSRPVWVAWDSAFPYHLHGSPITQCSAFLTRRPSGWVTGLPMPREFAPRSRLLHPSANVPLSSALTFIRL